MLIVQDRKKTEFALVLVGFVIVTLIFEFFLSKIATEGVWEWFLLSVGLFFATPLFIITRIWKRSPRDYFLALNVTRKSLLLTLLAVVVYVAVLWLFVVQLDWKGHLTLSKWVLGSTGLLLFINLAVVPLAVFSKEFFFRGFVLRSALPVVGVAGAIIFQAALFCVYEIYVSDFGHLPERYPQIVLLFLLNLTLGYIAWANKSIFVSALFSWAHILAVDLFFIYQLTVQVS